MKYLLIVFFIVCSMIGEFVPKYETDGSLSPMQCWGSTGTCWCEYSKDKKPFRITEHVKCPKRSI